MVDAGLDQKNNKKIVINRMVLLDPNANGF